ncbi:MAG: SCO family protein [Alphaproteobacteria bacterium]|nr:SCO family protein [Alphaproteobacteria bacterium]
MTERSGGTRPLYALGATILAAGLAGTALQLDEEAGARPEPALAGGLCSAAGISAAYLFDRIAEGGLLRAALGEPPAVGGPFELTGPDGAAVSDASLAGRPYAIAFGFTHCPDVCPTTLAEMAGWIDALGADADRIAFHFATLDPERDAPARLAAYVGAFSPAIRPLHGDRTATDRVIEAFALYARKVPLSDGDYVMDHTTGVFVMDAAGRHRDTLLPGVSVTEAVASLRAALEPPGG